MFVIGIVAIIGFVVLFRYFRKAFQEWNETNDVGPPRGFTLGDMRDMLQKGQITQAEYDRAKAAIVDATKRQAPAPVKPMKPSGPLDKIIEAERRGNAGPTGGRPTGGFPVIPPERPPRDGRS